MALRPTHAAAFGIVKNTLFQRFAELIRAQEQASSGKRILRPSDDPVGASRAIDLRAEQALVARWRDTAAASKPYLETTNAALTSAHDLMGQIRALAVQGLSGTLGDEDRAGLANQIESLKASLVDLANTTFDGKYVFAGTAGASRPFVVGPDGAVSYRGNADLHSVLLGVGVEVSVNVPGSDVFLSQDPQGLEVSGLSGLRVGDSPSQGLSWVPIEIRHDATAGTPGSGISLAGGGTNDTLIGDRALVVDGAAGTIQLGSGQVYTLPDLNDPDAADFVVRDENGAEVHLDVRGFDGTSSTVTLTGSGSIRAGSGAFVALDLGQTDLELSDPATGAVLHLNTTGVVRSSTDVAQFVGTSDAFAAIDAIISDLRNADGLSLDEVQQRMDTRLRELIRNQEAVLTSMGRAGAATQRLDATDSRLSDKELLVAGRLSEVEDIDLTEAVLAMTRAQQSMELAQMSGSRLLQTSLLDYLR